MLIQGQHGAPAPARLVTLQGARLKGMTLVLWCERCRRRARKACVDLPGARRNVSIGELWLMGRFRCGACGKPPLSLSVVAEGDLSVTLEHWGVGEPFVAERLRRHWRHDPYDRRDWAAWFRGEAASDFDAPRRQGVGMGLSTPPVSISDPPATPRRTPEGPPPDPRCLPPRDPPARPLTLPEGLVRKR